jgi:hypothetical protein
LNIVVAGSIGETSPLYDCPLKDVQRISMDMRAMTYINSIGVKNWIIWTVKIPPNCTVDLYHCPLVVASQASNVIGFVNDKIHIGSIRQPYVCDACDAETVRLVTWGKDYEYRDGSNKARIELPSDQPCEKCKAAKSNPDILIEKTFKFLG